MGNTKRLLNKEQAACFLDISTRTLDRRIKKGIIVPIKKGNSIGFIKEILPIGKSLRNLKPSA